MADLTSQHYEIFKQGIAITFKAGELRGGSCDTPVQTQNSDIVIVDVASSCMIVLG